MSSLLRAAAMSLALMAPLSVVAQPSTPPLPPSPELRPAGDWITTLKASPRFAIFARAMDQNGLSAQLKVASGLTIFAPTDDAFNALPAGQLQYLMSPGGALQLRKVLASLVIAKALESGAIKGSKGDVVTIGGAPVTLDGGAEAITVAGADVIQTDVRTANNVVVHAIDRVPIPPDVTFPPAPAAH